MPGTDGGKLVFAFSGLMPFSRRSAMELIEKDMLDCEVLDRCDQIFRREAGWSCLPYFFDRDPDETIVDCEHGYPLGLSLRIAMFERLRSMGVEPDAVIGMSAGEPASAYAAGVIDLRDALRIAIHTGRCLQALAGSHRMALVWLAEEKCREATSRFPDRLSVAVSMELESTVISGEIDALEALLDTLAASGVRTHKLPFNFAGHHEQIPGLRDSLLARLRDLSPRPAVFRMMSTVTGGWAGEQDFSPEYWRRHAMGRIHFRPAVQALLREGYDAFLEVGPRSAFSDAVPGLGGKVAMI